MTCYQSTDSLLHLVTDLAEQAAGSLKEFEILLVRDPTDNETAQLLDQLEQQFAENHQVKLTRNFGQQAATVAGIAQSSGEIIVTLDGDYQHTRAIQSWVLANPKAE